MNYFFVDYENVNKDGIVNMSFVNPGDFIAFMYSENAKNITIDAMLQIAKMDADFQYFKASVGHKNSLDFQLSSYLGYMIGLHKNEEAEFYIVSKDTGYDHLCEFWATQGVSVKRILNLAGEAEQPKPKEEAVTQPESKKQSKSAAKKNVGKMTAIDEIKKYLPENDRQEEILKIVNGYKTKMAIMNGLSKVYKDSKAAGAVYQKLKPLLKEKGKT